MSNRNADSIAILSDSDDEELDKMILKNEPALKNDKMETHQPNLIKVRSVNHAKIEADRKKFDTAYDRCKGYYRKQIQVLHLFYDSI